MADLGLLGGLAKGLQMGFSSYQGQRKRIEDREKYDTELERDRMKDALLKKAYDSGLFEKGVQEDEDGGYDYTPEHKDQVELKKATEQAGLLKSGYKALKDPVTGAYSVEAIPGFKDLDKEAKSTDIAYKKAAIDALKKKTNAKEGGKIIPAGESTNFAGAKSAVKELEDYNKLLGTVEDISGPVGHLKGDIMGFLQVGDTGKRAAAADAAAGKVAQVLGTYLEKGKLTDNDYAKYQKMLPTRRDTPEVRNAKTLVLKRLVAQRQNEELGTAGQAGYNVENIPLMEVPEEVNLSPKKSNSGLLKGKPDFSKMTDEQLKSYVGK